MKHRRFQLKDGTTVEFYFFKTTYYGRHIQKNTYEKTFRVLCAVKSKTRRNLTGLLRLEMAKKSNPKIAKVTERMAPSPIVISDELVKLSASALAKWLPGEFDSKILDGVVKVLKI